MANKESTLDVRQQQGGLHELLLVVKQNIIKSIKVATLAEVQNIDLNTGLVTVRPFPLIDGENNKLITCLTSSIPQINQNEQKIINLINILNKQDIVLVLFLDRNSLQSFKQYQKNQKQSVLLQDSEFHSDKYGIITNICYRK